jgi:hypothetical protein
VNTVNKQTLMRPILLVFALALASTSLLAAPVFDRLHARDENGQMNRPFGRQNGADRQQQPNHQRDAQNAQRGEGQRPQRLSPEERRQLRSDIRDAGREIYPQRR